jgi:hypothetical protein
MLLCEPRKELQYNNEQMAYDDTGEQYRSMDERTLALR